MNGFNNQINHSQYQLLIILAVLHRLSPQPSHAVTPFHIGILISCALNTFILLYGFIYHFNHTRSLLLTIVITSTSLVRYLESLLLHYMVQISISTTHIFSRSLSAFCYMILIIISTIHISHHSPLSSSLVITYVYITLALRSGVHFIVTYPTSLKHSWSSILMSLAFVIASLMSSYCASLYVYWFVVPIRSSKP